MPSRSKTSLPSDAAPIAPRASPAREQIIAGARAHFLTHGFRNVTMDDLAAELGMSKKTLYAHFASKLALVEAVVMDKLARADADLSHFTGDGKREFATALQQLLACLQKHLEEIKPSFVRDMRREAPEIFRIVEEKRGEMIQRHFGSLVVRGQRAGMIRKDISAHLIVEILLAATQAIVNPTRVEELGLTPQSAYAAVLNIVMEGALTDKGRTLS